MPLWYIAISEATSHIMKHKFKRTFTSLLPVEEGRSGECNNCGACCHLPFRCVFLKTGENNKEFCSIYTVRPPNCRKFPRTREEHELVKNSCGFTFSEVKQGNANEQPINCNDIIKS